MGFKSSDCVGKDISWRTCCTSLLLLYLWQNLLECFRSSSCMSTNTLQSTLQLGVIQVGCNEFTVCFLSKVSTFDSSVQRTLFHCSVSSLCALWPTKIFWHSFTSLTVVSWQQFCHIGQLHRVFSSQCILTDFLWHWFSCAVIFAAVIFLSGNLVTRMKLFSVLVAFGRPAILLVLFHPVTWCLNIIHWSSGKFLSNIYAWIFFFLSNGLLFCLSVSSRVLGILYRKKFWSERMLQKFGFNLNQIRITDFTTEQGT